MALTWEALLFLQLIKMLLLCLLTLYKTVQKCPQEVSCTHCCCCCTQSIVERGSGNANRSINSVTDWEQAKPAAPVLLLFLLYSSSRVFVSSLSPVAAAIRLNERSRTTEDTEDEVKMISSQWYCAWSSLHIRCMSAMQWKQQSQQYRQSTANAFNLQKQSLVRRQCLSLAAVISPHYSHSSTH